MPFNSRLIVLVAIMASLLEIIDTSIVNVAVPTMMGNLGCTLSEISVVITGYTVANAIILPISAWLSQQFGLRQYYLSCIALFTITSVACGMAPNLTTLILFRILQGLAGGALLPTSQALIFEQFPKEKAGIAGAIFGMSVMIGPTLGPVMGGYLTDNFGWRSIFNINLPIGIITLLIGLVCIKNVNKIEQAIKPKLDMFGMILLVLGIGCLQFFLERGHAEDWFDSRLIRITFYTAFISIVLFIWWERKVKFPIINIFLFNNRAVTCGVLLMASLGFFLYGIVFILPVYLQTVFHFTATQAGLIFIPGSLLTALMMPFIGKNLGKLKDPRIFIFIGLLFVEICLISMSLFSSLTTNEEILISLFLRGFALAFLFVPINATILSQFTGYEMSQVAGLLNLFRQIGGSIGIAVIDTIFTQRQNKNYHYLSEHVSMLNQNTQIEYFSSLNHFATQMKNTIGLDHLSNGTLLSISKRIQAQSFVLSFNEVIVIVGSIFLFSFIALYFLKIKKAEINIHDIH